MTGYWVGTISDSEELSSPAVLPRPRLMRWNLAAVLTMTPYGTDVLKGSGNISRPDQRASVMALL